MTCFLQNCFEENSNLAILSGKYIDPPGNHPYGNTHLQELIKRMLSVDVSRRADSKQVSKCIDAMIAGKPLPKRSSSSKSRSRTVIATATALSAPRKANESNSSRGTRGIHASPPPPPPPPPRTQASHSQNDLTVQSRGQRQTNSIPMSVVVDRRSTRAKERSKRYESSSGAKVSVDTDTIVDDLRGTKILMQSVPEHSAIRTKRDPRKKYSRHTGTTNSTTSSRSISVDHVYSDLETPIIAKKKIKKKAVIKAKPRRDDFSATSSPSLFGPDDEWSKFGTESTEMDGIEAYLDEALDRIKIFTSEDRLGRRASPADVSCEITPPLTPLEQSSITSISSTDYSFSRESRANKKKAKDPPGLLSTSSF